MEIDKLNGENKLCIKTECDKRISIQYGINWKEKKLNGSFSIQSFTFSHAKQKIKFLLL